MKNYKVWLNYFLFKLKLRKILPSYFIKKISICDNHEKLIQIDNDKTIFFAEEVEKPIYVRETVYKKLKNVQKNLETKNLNIKIYSAFREIEVQKKSWHREFTKTKKENPYLSEGEITRITSLKVANPQYGFGGHQTGGAIDLTICNNLGEEVNMGTLYAEYNEKTKMDAKNLSAQEKENRKILAKTMKKEGFVNYPGEWWHYCYGDSLWAAYSGKKTCCYGLTKIRY